jgi:cobalt/nickel transport system permease protein/cobalt/nickel transport protein
MSRRTFFAGLLVVTLLVAGVGSYYASSHPDGLEHVAEQTGFLDTADEPATADSPFADYETAGVDDARLGGGLAGVVGVLVVLLVMTGVAYAVRRRGRRPVDADSAA